VKPKTLKSIADIWPGKTPAKASYASSGDIKIVKFRDVKDDGTIDFANDDEGWLDSRYVDTSKLVDLPTEAILLTNAAHSLDQIGKKLAYVRSAPDHRVRYCFVGELTAIKSHDPDVTTLWLYQYLQCPDARREIARCAEGAHLVPRWLKRVPIPEIASDVRKLHVQIFELVETAIESARREYYAALNVKAALVQQLFVRGMPGRHRRFKQTKIGQIPREWSIESLSLAAGGPDCVKTGPFGAQLPPEAFVAKGVRLINITDIGDGYLDFRSEAYVREDLAKRLQDCRVKVGDLVFSRVASVGRLALITPREDGFLISSNCIRLRPGPKFDARFLLNTFLDSEAVRRQVVAASTGGARPIVTPRFLRKMLIPIADKDEQIAISSRIEAAMDVIATAQRKIMALEVLKTSLLQNLFAGRIQLNQEAPA
jgi:hypothetical protein